MKKYIFALSTCVFSIASTAFSQQYRHPVSAVYLSLGAYSTTHHDVFSFVNNQASLAKINNTQAGIYSERRFLLKETSQYTAAVAIPTQLGNFGIQLNYGGFTNFNEYKIGLAYARSLGSAIDIGIQFNYNGYHIPAYVNNSAVNFEIGMIAHLTDKLNMGVHVYNPVGGKFSKSEEQLTAIYKIGIGYDVSEIFFVSAEVVKEEHFPASINAGVQYKFMQQLFAKAGICSAISAPYAGIGVSWNNLRVDISGSYHPQLGFSPGILLIANFNKKSND
ncbi:MAG: hypothetical protein HY305_05450 [Sphingobacteriales bacterium]|nr:hypothetical protein [Sphingobacteriales bacterium]